MRFGDSETQKLLRDTARSYLATSFPWDRLYALESGEQPLSDEDLRGFADLGWFGLLAPESAGGGGLSLLEAAVVSEELGYAAVPAPVTVTNVSAALFAEAGATNGIADHLASLAGGKRLYTVSEASRGHANVSRGVPSGESPLVASGGKLSGKLPSVPFAGIADFVLAPLLVDGGRAFAAISLDGARLERVKLLDRQAYDNVYFESADFGNSVVLASGPEAEALHERCDTLVTAFSLIELAGMMQRVLEMTCSYIANRVQFGQPIAKFQAARHRAAELLMQTETTRWAAYHALWRFQENPDCADEIWLAKHWAIRAVGRVYEVSHLLHGGVGVGIEYPLHLYTQGLSAFAVRGGTMNEMVDRTVQSMNLGKPAEARA